MTKRNRMTGKELLRHLKRLGACIQAKRWVRENQQFTAEELWNSCERGDWLDWLFLNSSWKYFHFRCLYHHSAYMRCDFDRMKSCMRLARAVRRHVKWSQIEEALRA